MSIVRCRDILHPFPKTAFLPFEYWHDIIEFAINFEYWHDIIEFVEYWHDIIEFATYGLQMQVNTETLQGQQTAERIYVFVYVHTAVVEL